MVDPAYNFSFRVAYGFACDNKKNSSVPDIWRAIQIDEDAHTGNIAAQ